MAVSQTTIVLNDFGLSRRERTTSNGTSNRYTVTIEAAPLVHVFDAKLLGAGPATAIAEHLRARVAAIGADASPATQLKRKYATSALERGATWATRRYSGGKIGALTPNQSSRLFNDSGRFVRGIVAAPASDNTWVINVAANRLDPSTFRDGEAGLTRMYDQLRQYVPEFGDAAQLGQVASVRAAIGDSIDWIFVRSLGNSYQRNGDFRAEVRAQQLEALKRGLELLQTIAELSGG